ncbi:MAG: hypothetical protein ACI9M9_000795 [Flavobacteriaceae bacterium]|jgi:hypothetical protein
MNLLLPTRYLFHILFGSFSNLENHLHLQGFATPEKECPQVPGVHEEKL